MASIRVRTAEKSNVSSGGNEDKFYRTFEVGSATVATGTGPVVTASSGFAVMQWGSQSNGRSGGQYKHSPDPNDAASIFQKKLADGYTSVSDEKFDLPDAELNRITGSKQISTIGPELETAFFSAGTGGTLQRASGVPTTSPTAKRTSRITKTQVSAAKVVDVALDSSNSYSDMIAEVEFLAEQVLSTMGVAATDPVAAAVRAAGFRRVQERLHNSIAKVDNYLNVLTEMIEELG